MPEADVQTRAKRNREHGRRHHKPNSESAKVWVRFVAIRVTHITVLKSSPPILPISADNATYLSIFVYSTTPMKKTALSALFLHLCTSAQFPPIIKNIVQAFDPRILSLIYYDNYYRTDHE